MAADCAAELTDHNITMISLWPGGVKTELVVKEILLDEEVSQLSHNFLFIANISYWSFSSCRGTIDKPFHDSTHVCINENSDC